MYFTNVMKDITNRIDLQMTLAYILNGVTVEEPI